MDETANEIKRLQGCINDLISVLALPAMWIGQDPEQIVSTLLDVLVGMLRLDFAYVRLNQPVGGDLIEVVRHDPLRPLVADSRSVGQTFNDSFGAELRKWPPRARSPFGDGNLSIVPLGSGRENDIGVIVAASQRADFPWQTETVLLNVASNQAAIGLASARAYEQERLRGEALAQIDRVKTQFFSNVSHEFRTPLTLLLGPLDDVLLEASERLGPERHQQLLTVRRNALRLLKLVNTLLDFSRIEAGRVQATYEPTDLASFTSEIASAFDSAMDSAGLRFLVECQPIAEPVYVDRDMWEKVVLNLLSNAFKFTLEGEVAVTLKAVDGTVGLQVRDTGVGIPDDQRERVFERFHRIEGVHARTYEGTGIGLALVQELVKLHGGTVQVESVLGQGSTFTVTIPSGKAHLPAERIQAAQSFTSTKIRAEAYVKEAQQWLGDESGGADEVAMLGELPLPTSSPELKPTAKRELIILADDNTDMRRYLLRLLTDRYQVHPVADGSQALEAARQLRPALVLADVMMPRMDGFALLRAIREDSALCSTPVILVSARAGEESRVEGLQADADDYLVKPFTSRELLARVATHVKMAQLRRVTAEREERLRSEAELERQKLNASQELLAETSRFYRELQNREAKIRRLVDANIVGIFMWDVEGQILEANDAFLRMVGYGREDLASGRMRWTDLTPAEWRERDEQAIAEVGRTGAVQPYEKEYFKKDGIRIPVLLGGAMFEGSRNEGVAFVLDLSEQKHAEDQLRAVMSERMRLSAFRAEIAMALASKDTLRGILHRCAETIVRHFDAAFARIWTLKSGGTELELEASAGMYTRLDGRFSRIPVGQLKIGLIARERKAHLTNDVQNDPRISDHNWAKAEKMQSFAGYPLVVEDRVVGVMGMFSRQALTESALETLASIAAGIAQGIDRKRAEDALKLLKDQLYRENIALRDEVVRASMFDEIVGTSNLLKVVLSRIAKVAPTDSTVLITGETGTGKELIARAIHKKSQRSARAFVSVNCAAIPRDLIPSELFGHEKGAFTGAMQRRLGRFELADGGTIFLDEVGELLPDTQVALLRVLQERELERVGGGHPIHIDVRVIAATNRDLKAAVANGTFRQDLFYRLNVFPLEVPPLRERKDDLLLLVEYFVQRYATKAGKDIRSIEKKTLDLLQSYDWPGNIRELQNVIERSVILSSGDVFAIDELWLSKELLPTASLVKATPLVKGQAEPLSEREIIEAALATTRGRVSGPTGAAAKLGIPASTLETRIKALKINKLQFKFR